MTDTPHATVLVIGATSAIGTALSRYLAKAGYPLFLTGRDRGKLDPLAQELSAGSSQADVLDEGQIAGAVQEAARGGKLGGLVYCPGSIVLKPLSRVTATDMADAFALNVIGAAMAVKNAAPALKTGKGSVVLFSTIAVAQGFASHTIIASAKAGVEGLMRSLAAELAPDVRVNCVAPSLTNTPLAKSLTSNANMADAIAKMHPIPRLGEPEDQAAAAAFLLSPASNWMTGQVLHVDGGRSTLRPKG
jgi:NAD(P)-dependent dehydrogenase (short-subunit alcohol dehydrogenase family)